MHFNLNETINILNRTPAILRSQVSGFSSVWLSNNYGDDTWSVHEIIGHLIWGERTDWVPRAKHILEQGESTPFEPFDRSGHHSLCQTTSTEELLNIFEVERKESLEALHSLSLTTSDLEKRGIHPALGTVSLSELLSTWTVHDLNHIAQIAKAMAYQYGDCVGAWREYLSILSPPNPK